MAAFRSLALLMGLALAFPALAVQAQAAAPEAVTLDPIEFFPARLVVEGKQGSAAYDPAMLEAELGTYRIVTTTPWRPEPASFEGVMLRDLLARHGLDGGSDLRVTAENDYEVVIPGEVVSAVPILIATRVDGQPHTRRARGPLQFVMPMETFTDLGLTERYWVWMAARIEAAD